jgi:hypothetical protein
MFAIGRRRAARWTKVARPLLTLLRGRAEQEVQRGRILIDTEPRPERPRALTATTPARVASHLSAPRVGKELAP